MDLYRLVETKLNEFKIRFEIVDHPLTLTKEKKDSFIKGIEGYEQNQCFCSIKRNQHIIFLLLMFKK